jgi:hypothetical protein
MKASRYLYFNLYKCSSSYSCMCFFRVSHKLSPISATLQWTTRPIALSVEIESIWSWYGHVPSPVTQSYLELPKVLALLRWYPTYAPDPRHLREFYQTTPFGVWSLPQGGSRSVTICSKTSCQEIDLIPCLDSIREYCFHGEVTLHKRNHILI